MNKGTEDLIRRYFTGEVERVVVPGVPERPKIHRRFPAAEVLLAAAACLLVVCGGLIDTPSSLLAERAACFAESRKVGITITRGLETARNAALPVLRKGEKQ